MTNQPYQKLENIFREILLLESVNGLLDWDSATVMPAGGAAQRAEQMGIIATITHEKICSLEIPDLIFAAEQEDLARQNLNSWQQANLREMRHRLNHAVGVPVSLASELAQAAAESEHFWRSARKENDFVGFAPYLKNIIKLVQETAAAKAETLQCLAYDALLDGYDPGTNSASLDVIFTDLEKFLPEFIAEVLAHQAELPESLNLAPLNLAPLNLASSVHKQEELARWLTKTMGFDFNYGRLDTSTHPFCGGTAGDIRITTRYDAADFTSAFYGVAHETGHALYEANLPREWRFQPVGQARGMSLHESQSLFMEMQICQNENFLEFATPHIARILGLDLSVDALRANISRVQPSHIRVEADEVTYPAHILLRYKLEKALLSGDLPVDDLPLAWAENSKKLLGITPDCHANGCMQDIHWPMGSIGYFPTYSLGAMIAAQLFAATRAELPNLETDLQKGNFSNVNQWLKNNIHMQASHLSTNEILRAATGKELDVNYYKQHLLRRYLS